MDFALQLASVTPDLTLIMSLQSLARTCAVGGETSVSCDPDSVSEITFKVSSAGCIE